MEQCDESFERTRAMTSFSPVRCAETNKRQMHVMKNKLNKIKTTNEMPAVGRLGCAFLAALSSKKTVVGALASLILVTQASADPFFFSTGNPDGKIATLSRRPSAGKAETE